MDVRWLCVCVWVRDSNQCHDNIITEKCQSNALGRVFGWLASCFWRTDVSSNRCNENSLFTPINMCRTNSGAHSFDDYCYLLSETKYRLHWLSKASALCLWHMHTFWRFVVVDFEWNTFFAVLWVIIFGDTRTRIRHCFVLFVFAKWNWMQFVLTNDTHTPHDTLSTLLWTIMCMCVAHFY